MTMIEKPTPAPTVSAESYRQAVAACSDADRAYAGEVTQRLIEVVKAFGAVRNRMHGSNPQEGHESTLLLKLAHHGRMRASDLAEKLCSDPSTVSRQVAGLVKAGLVERQADPDDGRASILVLTEPGEARVRTMVEMRGRIFAPLVADWPAADRAVFSRLLADFVDGLSSNIEAVKDVAAELLQPGPAESQGRNA